MVLNVNWVRLGISRGPLFVSHVATSTQVGGNFLTAVLGKMNRCGRISCCGALSEYNQKEPELGN